MKTEVLKELNLTDEQIEGVMRENGKDIEAEKAKSKSSLEETENLRSKLEETQKTLDSFKDIKPEQLQEEITTLKTQLSNTEKEWKEKVDEINFNNTLKGAISGAQGKNATAITALLDIEGLKTSENQEEALKEAVAKVMESDPYLFGEVVPQEEQQEAPPFFTITKSGGAKPEETIADRINKRISKA